MRCGVLGCSADAVYTFGVRCRRRDTRALWAPNADAGLCHFHATNGLRINVGLEPMPLLGGVEVVVAGLSRFVPFSERSLAS